MRIRFLRDAKKWCGNRVTKQADKIEGSEEVYQSEEFKEGQIVDLPDDQAKRWTKRGAAEFTTETPSRPAAATKPAAVAQPVKG